MGAPPVFMNISKKKPPEKKTTQLAGKKKSLTPKGVEIRQSGELFLPKGGACRRGSGKVKLLLLEGWRQAEKRPIKRSSFLKGRRTSIQGNE